MLWWIYFSGSHFGSSLVCCQFCVLCGCVAGHYIFWPLVLRFYLDLISGNWGVSYTPVRLIHPCVLYTVNYGNPHCSQLLWPSPWIPLWMTGLRHVFFFLLTLFKYRGPFHFLCKTESSHIDAPLVVWEIMYKINVSWSLVLYWKSVIHCLSMSCNSNSAR